MELPKHRRKQVKASLMKNWYGWNVCVCGFEGMSVLSVMFLDSSMVEHSAVNRRVVGSSPTRGAFFQGSVVKRLRHRPFTAVTRVRFPSESLRRRSQVVRQWSATPVFTGSNPVDASLKSTVTAVLFLCSAFAEHGSGGSQSCTLKDGEKYSTL